MNQLNVGVVTFTATGVLPGAEETPNIAHAQKTIWSCQCEVVYM